MPGQNALLLLAQLLGRRALGLGFFAERLELLLLGSWMASS